MRRKASMEERGNKLWHGSRFVLPEHREAMLYYEKQTKKCQKPTLDSDKLQEMSWILAEAIQDERFVKLTLYRPFGNETVTLLPRMIDPVTGNLKGETEEDRRPIRIRLTEILDISFV